jgi:hypothetical protein
LLGFLNNFRSKNVTDFWSCTVTIICEENVEDFRDKIKKKFLEFLVQIMNALQFSQFQKAQNSIQPIHNAYLQNSQCKKRQFCCIATSIKYYSLIAEQFNMATAFLAVTVVKAFKAPLQS